MILVVLLYALFGFSFTLGKIILDYATPLFAVGSRMLIAGILLMVFTVAKHKISCYPRRQDWKYYIRLTFFSIFIPYTLRLWALQYVTTTKAALLFNVRPFFTALLVYLIMGIKLNKLQVLGLVIGFIGMIPILLTGTPLEDSIANVSFMSLPEFAIILAVASMSYGLIIVQKLVKERKCPPYLINAVSMFFGGFFALNTSLVFESNVIKAGILPLAGILGLQILISNIICANLQGHLLRRYSATFMSFASFLGPLFTSIYGVALFKEQITWHFFASFITVIAGLALYSKGENTASIAKSS